MGQSEYVGSDRVRRGSKSHRSGRVGSRGFQIARSGRVRSGGGVVAGIYGIPCSSLLLSRRRVYDETRQTKKNQPLWSQTPPRVRNMGIVKTRKTSNSNPVSNCTRLARPALQYVYVVAPAPYCLFRYPVTSIYPGILSIFSSFTGRVASGPEVSKISRVGSGHVKEVQHNRGSGRVRPEPTRDLIREILPDPGTAQDNSRQCQLMGSLRG